MIDFQSGGVFARLGPSDPRQIATELAPILIDGESVYLSFKGVRDSVVFTNKRLITINVQGLTGKKRDYSSLPYSKIQAWSIETAGRFDLDAELHLWFSGLGMVRLGFQRPGRHPHDRKADRQSCALRSCRTAIGPPPFPGDGPTDE